MRMTKKIIQSSEKTKKWLDILDDIVTSEDSKIESYDRKYYRMFYSKISGCNIVYLHPSARQIRLFLKADPSEYDHLLVSPSGTYHKYFPSEFKITDEELLEEAAQFILLSNQVELENKGLLNGNPNYVYKESEEDEDETDNLDNDEEFDSSDQCIACDINEPPSTVESTTNRIIRDYKSSLSLKNLYNYQCQICGESIDILKNGEFKCYIEAHHIKPLGTPHNGPDTIHNMLVLCPNHHAQFDFGSITINPDDLTICHINNSNKFDGDDLILEPAHRIYKKYLRYHYEEIYRG